jgi:hypothetical protein
VCLHSVCLLRLIIYKRFYTLEKNPSVTFAQRSLYSDSEGSLSAEQIVNRFADNAGLDLNDVITNYSQYAHAIQQSFASRGNFKT